MTLAEAENTFQVQVADVIAYVRDGVEIERPDDDTEVIAVHDYSGAGEVEIEVV